MAVWSAFVYYLIRLVIFTAVAALGITLGIKFRRHKNEKAQAVKSEE
ncbi:MAG: hypothetical protein J1F22_05060 [Lachnospiraceae bacterium]|nr:hypothetical protein [Lachnospiraceae bacterium]